MRMLASLAALLLFINSAAAQKRSRDISVSLTAPDAGYQLQISEVYELPERLIVIAAVSRRPDIMAAQVMTDLSSTVTVTAEPALPVEYFVLGKSWSWQKEPYMFIRDKAEIADRLKAARRIYPAAGK